MLRVHTEVRKHFALDVLRVAVDHVLLTEDRKFDLGETDTAQCSQNEKECHALHDGEDRALAGKPKHDRRFT